MKGNGINNGTGTGQSRSSSECIRAWKVTIKSKNWKQFESVIAAATRGRAISLCWRDAQEAGYRILWKNFRAVRAPKFDTVAQEGNRRYLGYKDGSQKEGVYRVTN